MWGPLWNSTFICGILNLWNYSYQHIVQRTWQKIPETILYNEQKWLQTSWSSKQLIQRIRDQWYTLFATSYSFVWFEYCSNARACTFTGNLCKCMRACILVYIDLLRIMYRCFRICKHVWSYWWHIYLHSWHYPIFHSICIYSFYRCFISNFSKGGFISLMGEIQYNVSVLSNKTLQHKFIIKLSFGLACF